MGLTKDCSLAIVPQFLNLLVVPENKRKFIVSTFRPIDSTVFVKLRGIISLLIDPFSLNEVSWYTGVFTHKYLHNDFHAKTMPGFESQISPRHWFVTSARQFIHIVAHTVPFLINGDLVGCDRFTCSFSSFASCHFRLLYQARNTQKTWGDRHIIHCKL